MTPRLTDTQMQQARKLYGNDWNGRVVGFSVQWDSSQWVWAVRLIVELSGQETASFIDVECSEFDTAVEFGVHAMQRDFMSQRKART
jgi:hypothetical protein